MIVILFLGPCFFLFKNLCDVASIKICLMFNIIAFNDIKIVFIHILYYATCVKYCNCVLFQLNAFTKLCPSKSSYVISRAHIRGCIRCVITLQAVLFTKTGDTNQCVLIPTSPCDHMLVLDVHIHRWPIKAKSTVAQIQTNLPIFLEAYRTQTSHKSNQSISAMIIEENKTFNICSKQTKVDVFI